MKVLLGVTGSIAAVLTDKFIESLSNADHTTALMATNGALQIAKNHNKPVDMLTIEDNYFDDKHEWARYRTHQEVVHIELVKWADVFIIAPCSANTLAKLANGLCDNLVTCCARAWDFQKQMIIAPAMNTQMWKHPTTETHLNDLHNWGATIVEPQSKMLYCKDEGIGAMADISKIISRIRL